MQAPIDRELADLADRMECYCGRQLDVRPAIVCSGCQRAPNECECKELIDGEEAHATAGGEDGGTLEEDAEVTGEEDRGEQEAKVT